MNATVLPVSHSLVDAQVVLSHIKGSYAIDGPGTCQLLSTGINDTYLLTMPDARYIGRLYRFLSRDPAEIAYELDLLSHLARQGVPVSTPVADRTGERMRPLAAPEGTRYLVLFTHAPGAPLSWHQQSHPYLAGRLAAMIHAASDDFTSEHARMPLDLPLLLDDSLAAVRPFLEHRKDDWAYLQQFARALRLQVAAVIDAGLDWGVCHGDYHSLNIHVTGDGTTTVFDFDFCGPGWRAWDLFEAPRKAARRNRPDIWERFLDGYTAVRPLAAGDLAAIKWFDGVRHLWSLGQAADKVSRWGLELLSDRHLDVRLSALRRWENEHLGAN